MHFLNMSTIVFTNALTFTVCAVMIGSLWRETRTRYPGLGLLTADLTLNTIALYLFMLRGIAPDWLTIVIANALLYAGTALGYWGLLRFTGLRGVMIHHIPILLAFTASYAWYSLIAPDTSMRNIIFPIVVLIPSLQCVWLLFRRTDARMRRIASGVGFTFVYLLSINIIRIIVFFAAPGTDTEFFSSTGFYAVIMISYLIGFFMLTYSISLMVSKRLISDIAAQEEKFSAAFHSSPNSILLSRETDGTILEANEGFFDITGYTPAEIRGRTSTALHIWKDESERNDMLAELQRKGRIRQREMLSRRKDGSSVFGLFSADLITVNGERCILSTFSDITDRKHMEEEIREMSLRDSMTGLYNRRGLFALADHELALARRERKPLMAVYIDCDGLKLTNDNYGHEAGDRLIMATAAVLRATFRDSDIIARTGGDEFVILCPDAADFRTMMASRLEEQIRKENTDTVMAIPLSLSWGAALFTPSEPVSFDELLAEADRAMYSFKRSKAAERR